MQRLITPLIVLGLAWYAYSHYQERREAASDASLGLVEDPAYACDGRAYCSEMRSCEEATYFVTYCPGTKMDGDHDGVPCESQWC